MLADEVGAKVIKWCFILIYSYILEYCSGPQKVAPPLSHRTDMERIRPDNAKITMAGMVTNQLNEAQEKTGWASSLIKDLELEASKNKEIIVGRRSENCGKS